jgi:nucleoside-diphosphate-sugar epimerase
LDAGALARGVEGVRPDCVIHLAAEIASQRDGSKIAEVNVEGSRRLLAACAAGGRPRFVFASTVVTGDAGGAQLEEGSPLTVETAYGRSKQEGERLVRGSGLDNVIIRPSHVYGPGGWYEEEFVRRLRQPGRFAVIGRGDNLWDVVHVDDVAVVLADSVERAKDGAVYHVADDDPVTYYEFVKLTADALGVGAPRRIPTAVARLVGGRDPVTAVVRSARTSNERVKRELGWEPRFPSARVGIPDAVAKLGVGS